MEKTLELRRLIRNIWPTRDSVLDLGDITKRILRGGGKKPLKNTPLIVKPQVGVAGAVAETPSQTDTIEMSAIVERILAERRK